MTFLAKFGLFAAFLFILVGQFAAQALRRRAWRDHQDWARRTGLQPPTKIRASLRESWSLRRRIWTADPHLGGGAMGRILIGLAILRDLAVAGLAVAMVIFAYLRMFGGE